MSYQNGIISEPVNLPRDIQRALGVSSTDLGGLCISQNINKWAMYKPERLSPIDNITLAQRKANYFGLTPLMNTKARAVAFGYGGTDAKNIGDTGYTIADIEAANLEWTYTRPTGGTSSPFRLTDFACDRAKTYGIQGYRHEARSPLFGWTNWEIFLSDINAIINASIVDKIYNTGSDPAAWKVDNILYDGTFYNAISGRLSENSASCFGGGGSDMIPISWLLSGVASENWRIGLGVFIEGETKMLVFTSSYSLQELANATTVMSQGPVFPALGTNQFLCKKMVNALGSSASKTFQAIPILVRNCQQSVGQLDGGQQTLITFSGTNTQIFSVPSDSTTITITLRDETKPTVAGLTTVEDSNTSDNVFILGTYGTGQYAGDGSSASITPVMGIGIFLTDNHSFTGSKTLVFNVTYNYGLNGHTRTQQTVQGTVTITNNNTVEINGTTHVGVTIAAGPGIGIESFDRLRYE